MWVFSGNAEFFAEAMERRLLGHPTQLDITADETMVVYRPDEESVVGVFEPQGAPETIDPEAFDGERPFQVRFEPSDQIYSATVDSPVIQEVLAEGGPLNEMDTQVVRKRLQKSDTTIEVDEAVEEAADEVAEHEGTSRPLTLHNLSRSPDPIDAAKRDFSGEEHGRLRLDEAQLRGADLSHTKLEGTTFTGAELQGVDFRGARLVDVDFSGASLHRADFRGADLTGATLSGNLRECRFEGAVLNQADFRDATIEGAEFTAVQMQNADLRGTNPISTSFDRADLRGVQTRAGDRFQKATFRKVDLSGVEFAQIDLTQAVFDGANLRKADLTRPILEDTMFLDADLSGADLEGQDARGLDFSGANLSGATLREVDLDDARFAEARLNATEFHSADISGAVVSDAKASDAVFDGANLERVAFSQTELFGARFVDAALYGAILQSARIGGDTRFHAEDDDDHYIVYDPRSDEAIPDGVVSTPSPIEKAMSVYRTLETVMRENAYGDRSVGYLRHRKEMALRKHRATGNLIAAATNRLSYYSCGYGESFFFLFGWATLLVTSLGVAYPLLGLTHSSLGPITYEAVGHGALIHGLRFSVSAFTGLGYGPFSVDLVGEALATVETGAGVVFFALFVFVLTRRVNR